jgi:phage shock protein PspC (stress-responsive transcriptional regulator)
MVSMRDRNGSKVLMRPRDGRMLAGVCAGVADYFGLDVTLVRVIWAVLAVITGGAGILAYLVAWILIPNEGQQSSVAENTVGKKQDSYSG